jgi:hypothetical protein
MTLPLTPLDVRDGYGWVLIGLISLNMFINMLSAVYQTFLSALKISITYLVKKFGLFPKLQLSIRVKRKRSKHKVKAP